MNHIVNNAHVERLIFALDVPDFKSALALVETLGDKVVFYKVGMELFASGDAWRIIEMLQSRGKKVFVDLKFFDIPATVGRAIKRLANRGVDFATIHGLDQGMMEAAVFNKGERLKVLVVTLLTSVDVEGLSKMGLGTSSQEFVLIIARRAARLCCDGVVASGLEAEAIRTHPETRDLLIVTPGIRPTSGARQVSGDDQKRVVSVGQAIANGASHLVVGRPIRDAESPAAAAFKIQKEIRDCFIKGG